MPQNLANPWHPPGDGGHCQVVDASGIASLSAGGVRVLAEVADRLRASGGELRWSRGCCADLMGVPKV